MKKFLTVLLIGGMMAGSIFAFNANAPRVYHDSDVAPMYENYSGIRGGYMFSDEELITANGTIESIEENENYPGMLEIKVKFDNGEIVELHANSYFVKDLEVGKNIELKGWIIKLNDETIFKPIESKIDGKEVVLNGFKGMAMRGSGYTTMQGYIPNRRPVNNFRGMRNSHNLNYNNWNHKPMMNNYYNNYNFRNPAPYNQMPGYSPMRNPAPMPRGRR
ncbi:hypothetical protein X275_00035 [Marinitoga sp. 1197]|uniref:hypothetical protein n=1 Tax=Marinitoga sp. 1197 TaxID=1428449 RepID=UPI000640EC39|nr:hypothetical protein [Marinitoga sp. 1197]KLO24460.1 hypothetical protein X275_00035 [Marinitoga sp. 1197]